jgi:hypothetical protein
MVTTFNAFIPTVFSAGVWAFAYSSVLTTWRQLMYIATNFSRHSVDITYSRFCYLSIKRTGFFLSQSYGAS